MQLPLALSLVLLVAAQTVTRDEELALFVDQAFQKQKAAFPSPPELQVRDGVVTLTGTVETLAQGRAAERLVESVEGVEGVENALTVVPREPRSDEEIARDVRLSLERNIYLSARALDFRVERGVLHLGGTVDNAFERHHAEEVLSYIPGLIRVDNDIRVEENARSAADDRLRTRVVRRLYWSPWVDADQVGVAVQRGVVILKGTVDTARERTRAEDLARDAGATEVRNELHVRGVDAAPLGGRRRAPGQS
ncbi:MAG: BON domain-containing protein [Myxococcota bacterium]